MSVPCWVFQPTKLRSQISVRVLIKTRICCHSQFARFFPRSAARISLTQTVNVFSRYCAATYATPILGQCVVMSWLLHLLSGGDGYVKFEANIKTMLVGSLLRK